MDIVSECRGGVFIKLVHARLGCHNGATQRLHSSSFLGLPYRILNMNPKKELLRSLRLVLGI